MKYPLSMRFSMDFPETIMLAPFGLQVVMDNWARSSCKYTYKVAGCPMSTSDNNLWCRYPQWMTSAAPAEAGLIKTSRQEIDGGWLPIGQGRRRLQAYNFIPDQTPNTQNQRPAAYNARGTGLDGIMHVGSRVCLAKQPIGLNRNTGLEDAHVSNLLRTDRLYTSCTYYLLANLFESRTSKDI
jgi:hypothetical protein